MRYDLDDLALIGERATHGDSSAFRARMAEYARRASRDTDAAEAAKRG